MANTYKSGLKRETLQAIVDANAIDRLSGGTVRQHGKVWRGFLTYTVDSAKDERNERHSAYQKSVSKSFSDLPCVGRGKVTKATALKRLGEWRGAVIDDCRVIAQMGVDASKSTEECMRDYLEHKELMGAEASTLSGYRAAMGKKRLDDAIAKRPFDQLSRADVQAWVDRMSKKGFAPRSIKKSVDLMRAAYIYKVGVPNGMTDPFASLSTPSIKQKNPNALSELGVTQLNAALDNLEAEKGITSMSMGARLALHTGMRLSEVCGLRWCDVDLDGATLHVTNVIGRAVDRKDSDGNTAELYAKAPKSEAGRRDIPLDADIVASLRKRRAAMHEEWFQLTTTGGTPNRKRPEFESLYVCGYSDGRFFSPHWMGQQFIRFSKQHDFDVTNKGEVLRFHDVRHSYATRCINAGINVRVVSALLGHSDPSLTLRVYTSRDDEANRAAVDAMAGVFSARPQVLELSSQPTGTEG
jgi:integrase